MSPAALVLVAGSLTVEALPPVELPPHDPDDAEEAAAAEAARAAAQAEQDAAGEAALVCDDWLRFRVPLAVLSQLACLRIRLASAFAAKVQRPGATLAPELAAALGAAAMLLAHDGGAAAEGDRAGEALGAGGYGQGTGMGGGRPGDWQCPRGCGTVFANKSNCFRCGAPKGGGGGGGGGGGRRGFGGGGRGGGGPGADGERSAAEVRPHRACSRAEGADAEGDVAEVAVEVAAGGDELEGILQGGLRDTRRGFLRRGVLGRLASGAA